MGKAREREMSVIWVMEAAGRALEKYSSDNVDAVVNEETGKVDVIYHSNKNSFPIEAGVADVKYIDMSYLAECLDKIGVGHCW